MSTEGKKVVRPPEEAFINKRVVANGSNGSAEGVLKSLRVMGDEITHAFVDDKAIENPRKILLA